MNRLAWAFLAACLVVGSAPPPQPIQLSQIVSKPYPGVMVNTGSGWVQASIDATLQILVVGPSQYTLHAVQGGGSTPTVPAPPYTVLPTGVANFPAGISTGSIGQPSKVVLVKPDGSSCTLVVGATGAVTCN